MIHLPLTLKIGIMAKLLLAVAAASLVAAVIEPHDILVPLWISIVVAVSAIITPLINAWTRSREEIRRWKREDEVAKKVEGVRKTALTTADKVEEVAIAACKTNNTVARIHNLVNGERTLIMQSDLDSKKVALALMTELTELKRTDHDVSPSEETLATLNRLRIEISNISDRIAKRHALEKLDGGMI